MMMSVKLTSVFIMRWLVGKPTLILRLGVPPKICPLLEYASPIWGSLPEYLAAELYRIQDCCLGILGLPKDNLKPLAQSRHYDQE